MGQEWAASSPFLYFTDHEPALGKLVTEGRRREFAKFKAFRGESARESIPDPQAESTFAASRLDWDEARREPHAGVLRLHRALLALRRETPALRASSAHAADAPDADTVRLRRDAEDGSAVLLVARLRGAGEVRCQGEPIALGRRFATVLLSTEDAAFTGDPAPIALGGGAVRFTRPGAVVLLDAPAG
jgi:maltooligosyltrehalose trehalohydrolase